MNRSGSNDLVIQNNTWSGASNNVDYNESFTYDANGNILTLTRYGTSTQQQSMDDLTYNYYSGTNRLEYVEDIVDPDNYTTDIDDQNTGNYTYDEIGNLKSDAQEGISDIAWTVYGKIKSITKTGSGDHLEFKYDAQGNRIAKIAKPSTTLGTPSTWTTTYYLRDAQGNALATYEDKPNDAGFHIMENALYGSSRLGIMRREIDLLNLPTGGEGHYSGTRGKKAFELSNHLGNVLEVVSDQKKGIDDTGSDGIADYYTANILSSTDYYAFGSQMPGRVSTSADNYRYGYNGKEKDDEIHNSSGTSYDFGERQYDPRIGIFLSRDPLSQQYPWQSPYAYIHNNPILMRDVNGEGDPLTTMKVRENRASNLQGKVRTKNGIANSKVHQGFDLYAAPGTSVKAVKNAVVENIITTDDGDYGKQITLRITDENGVATYAHYSHLSCVGVEKGQEVTEGQEIGESGMTGNAKTLPVSQAHLHFEYRNQPNLGTGLSGRLDPNLLLDTKFYSQNPQFSVVCFNKKIQKQLGEGCAFV